MGLWDVLGKGFEEWGSGVNAEKYGPDWREQLMEREAQRYRAAAAERRAQEDQDAQRAGEKMTLAEKLAQTAADAMEAEQAPGDAGQIGIGNYQVNLPTEAPPDYSTMLPEDLVSRTGQSREAIIARARGKHKLSRRQLEILKAANQFERQSRGFGYGRETREDQQAAALDRLNKTLKVRESEGEKNRGQRERFHEDVGKETPAQRERSREKVKAEVMGLTDQENKLKQQFAVIEDQRAKKLISEQDYAAEMDALKNEMMGLTQRRSLVHPASGTEETPAPDAGVGPTTSKPSQTHGAPVARRRRPDGGYDYKDAQGNVWSD